MSLITQASNCIQNCVNHGGTPYSCAVSCGGIVPGEGGKISNPALSDTLRGLSGAEYVQGLVPRIIGIIFIIGITFFVLFFLLGGIGWIISGGDKAKVEQAKGRLTSALIGIFLLLAVFAIIQLVEAFFGVSLLHLNLGPLVV